uniref:DUF4397 domain-containing protein n=1 Tax=Anaerolinea thermolimosa TaxID=229919 RepID=A0A7C4PKT5_9CHLR
MLLVTPLLPAAEETNNWEKLRELRPGHRVQVIDDKMKSHQGALAGVTGSELVIESRGQATAIEPLLLTDDNSAPPAGQAKVRFVHASPNAPAVDVAVTAGPVLFSNVPFRGVGSYVFVAPGGVDLVVRRAGTDLVLLAVPGVLITAGVAYTIYAVGLVDGQPPLALLISVDSVAGTPVPSGG